MEEKFLELKTQLVEILRENLIESHFDVGNEVLRTEFFKRVNPTLEGMKEMGILESYKFEFDPETFEGLIELHPVMGVKNINLSFSVSNDGSQFNN